jgi:hypothetical protein
MNLTWTTGCENAKRKKREQNRKVFHSNGIFCKDTGFQRNNLKKMEIKIKKSDKNIWRLAA